MIYIVNDLAEVQKQPNACLALSMVFVTNVINAMYQELLSLNPNWFSYKILCKAM